MQTLPTVAELFHRARAKVFDQRIRRVEQPVENLTTLGGFEVERDRLLTPVDRGEIGRFAILERAVLASVVALRRRLDLDYARSELGEQQGAVRARQDAGEIDDCDVGKRPSLSHGSSSFCNAKTVNSLEHHNLATRLCRHLAGC